MRAAAEKILEDRKNDKESSVYGAADGAWATRTLKRLKEMGENDAVTIGYTGETGRYGDS